MITVVGIGEKKDEISFLGKKIIDSASYVVVRTSKQSFGIKFDASLDDLYLAAASYEQFNRLAADRLLMLQKQYGDIVYAVAGDGFCDSSVEWLHTTGAEITHVAGVSTIRPATTSVLLLNAYDLPLKPQLDNLPLMIQAIDSPVTASEVKLYLLRFYAYDTPVLFYLGEKATKITLEDLDRQPKYNAFCKAFLSAKENNNKSEFDKSAYTFGDLVRITERLTGTGGCAWDIGQTHASIRTNLIEEAYEAVSAIDGNDTDNLIEELGDVMLQSVFHADIARRHGEFELSDVITALCRKLYTRHTHIFGDKSASNKEDALKNWEEAKTAENQSKFSASTDNDLNKSDRLKRELIQKFRGFPSALRAQKVLKKLIKEGVLSKEGVLQGCNNIDKNTDFGKILFDAVAMCELNGIDAETMLNEYLNKLLKP